MTTSRKIKNYFRRIITWIASAIVVFVLFAVIFYIFSNGWKSLDASMFSGDFYPTNILTKADEEAGIAKAGQFERPNNLSNDIPFSENYGFALRDEVNRENKEVQSIVYVDPDSPLKHDMVIATAGENKGKHAPFDVGTSLLVVHAIGNDGSATSHGQRKGESATELVAALDNTSGISGYQSQIPGGGIRGPIISTVILIGMTMLLSMPIALGAAIYLQRIAKDNKLTQIIRSSINLLAGVPSIIFGLMGITVLFPITKALGVDGLSILLGSFTLAIMLLPVLIRQSEEALLSVPNSYTMASLALGATETQTLFKVVLPAASPGILSAFLLGISRVIGESAALIFTIGTAVNEAPSLGSGGSSLAVLIWSLMGGETPNYRLSSAVSLVILALVLILNITVKIIVGLTKKEEVEKVV